jgi:hypothetical protein
MPSQNSASTFRDGASGSSQFDVMEFFFRQKLAKARTATIVRVLDVTNAGGLEPVGYVDIQPMVQQVDGAGQVTAMPPIYNAPYLRLQGGADAVILDPKIGDIGIAVIGDRDLSAVTASKADGPPGSARRNSLSDAMYLGGILNGVPEQYVRFSAGGVEIVSPTKITLRAPDIELDGPVSATSTVTAVGEVMGIDIPLSTHHHILVQPGSGNSGGPSS